MKQPWGTSSSQGPRAQRHGDEHASKEAGWSLLKSIGTGRLCCMARLRNLTIALKKAQGIHHKGVRVPDVVTRSCIIDIHGSSWRTFLPSSLQDGEVYGQRQDTDSIVDVSVRAYEARL